MDARNYLYPAKLRFHPYNARGNYIVPQRSFRPRGENALRFPLEAPLPRIPAPYIHIWVFRPQIQYFR